MKKFLSFILFLSLSIISTSAKDSENYYINFDGERYNLLYSVKNKDFGGYLNEYYKNGETYHNWSEMVAIHHFPNVYSPIDQVKWFKDFLNKKNCLSELTFDDKNNAAMIDFVMINDKRLPVVSEFNVFKYQRSEKNGSVAIQYVKRYTTTTARELEAAKKDFAKNRKKTIKEVKSYKIPDLITIEIDKCKLVSLPEEKDNSKQEDPKITNNTEKLDDSLQISDKREDENSIDAAENISRVDIADSEKQEENIVSAINPVNQNSNEYELIPNVPIPVENDLIRKQMGFENNYLPVKKIKKSEYAPTPNSGITKANANKNKTKTKTKTKKNKNETYQVINTKDDFYAKPVKRKNISPRKAAKLRAKEAAKKLNDNL